ncbi:MAG: SpoIIE family protein phosphatase [Bryobacteraceae bacterium]
MSLIAETNSSQLPASPVVVAAQRRPTARYVVLAILFVFAVAYQLRAIEYHFPQWFGDRSQVAWPFYLDAEDQPNFILLFVQPNAYSAGIRNGDTLLEINGHPATGRDVFADAIRAAHPGVTMKVTVRHKGDRQSSQTVAVPLASSSNGTSPLNVLFYVLMPALCLTLGFGVAAVRIRDVRAWLLLALLLGVAALFNPSAELWEPKVRILVVAYFEFQSESWLAWLFLLGVYFPEPFPAEARWKWWNWLQWILLPMCAVYVVAYVAAAVGALHNLAAVTPINRWIAQTRILEFVVVACCTLGGFLVCIAAKYRLARSADAKRRLRVLYAGATVALAPLIISVAIARLHATAVDEYLPHWLRLVTYVLFCLLPVTFAYVIVVQRAMDLRVVIRQGLQYTLARGGVVVLQAALIAGLIIAIATLAESHAMMRTHMILIVAGGITLIFLVRRLALGIARWIDRLFFRDAYNTEQILSELAERVRTIVETQPLLETVAQRIADSLHTREVAVLLRGSGFYQPAHAVGCGSLTGVVFPDTAATVQVLKQREAARVYFDDPDSWIYRTPEMSSDELRKLKELRSELLLPLSVKDDLIGFMSLGQKLSQAPYSGTDLHLLSSVAAQTALALEVSRLTTAIGSEMAHRERLNRELEIARDVQEHLFPQHLPSVPGLDYYGRCRPAREVGGDYYDFIELPDENLGIAIGDISGKGIGAALMMASLEASLRGLVPVARDLAELMERVNKLVYEASASNRYATFFYAQYSTRTRQLAYVNAGHNPPMIVRKTAESYRISRLETGGPVIGLLPNVCYQQGSFELSPGDLAVLFTDGVSESMNSADEEWGEERLANSAMACYGLGAEETIGRIITEAEHFAAGAPQYDDMTLVVLRIA